MQRNAASLFTLRGLGRAWRRMSIAQLCFAKKALKFLTDMPSHDRFDIRHRKFGEITEASNITELGSANGI